MVKLARSGRGWRGPFHALYQLLNRRPFAQIDELVGIRHPEIDLVAGLQFVLQHFFAVDERAMAATHVFEHPTAIYWENLGLLTANAAIAKGQLVASLPSNAEGRGVQGHIAANAARFNHH